MNRYGWLTILCLILAPSATASEVVRISWPTEHAARAPDLDAKAKLWLPAVRFGVEQMHESDLVKTALIGAATFKLLPDETLAELRTLTSSYYRRMAEDEHFPEVPSALPYCYSTNKPDHGLANIYVPDKANADSPVIVLLHGYGGSFSLYLHYLANTCPNHIIICPAYGISCWNIPPTYMRECITEASLKLGFELQKPALVGLSAGGFGGFNLYAKEPGEYQGFVCMAAFPPRGTRIPPGGKVRIIAGSEEFFARDGTLARAETNMKRGSVDVASHLIDGGDHFFLLSKEDETKRKLGRWINEFGETD